MATRTTSGGRPVRALLTLTILLTLIFGGVVAGAKYGEGQVTPKLALDLEGGTQIILTPRTDSGEEITTEAINEAISIIRQRVDAAGVAEAEITSQGGQNIVVALAGEPDQATLDLVRQSAQMQFRPVLVEAMPEAINPDEQLEDEDGEPIIPDDADADAAEAEDGDVAKDSGAADADDAGVDADEPEAETDESGADAETPADDATNDESADDSAPAPAAPENPSDPAWITDDILDEFYALDCTADESLVGGGVDNPDAPLVTCDQEGRAKYILGPVEVHGSEIRDASAGLEVNSAGIQTNNWIVNLEFKGEGKDDFATISRRLIDLEPPRNQFGIVLDNLVVSAPRMNNIITDGRAQISGNFTRESAQTLSSQLRFGALPLSFEVQSEEQISATLGSEQLEKGLIAGVIGLFLVVLFSLYQYRGLGMVTIASLAIAGLLTYGLLVLLGTLQGYRLSLPGVAGVIVAIGITADSFIVYFERVRDEVREGRRLPDAVEQGWKRARRTILASDAVNILGAIVLYVIAVGGVRGFAFTLGLTMLIDIIVVMLFTYPIMQVLIRTKFFGEGSRLSGLDPEHLGAVVSAYRGRGQIRSAAERMTIAERRKAEAMAAAGASGESEIGRAHV